MPSSRQASAVRNNDGQSIPPDPATMAEVSLTPSPVMPSTPMMIDAQMMMEAIIAIWRPALINASAIRPGARPTASPEPSNSSSPNPDRIASAAAYCGVKPSQNIAPSSKTNGTRKKAEVIATSRRAGRSSSGKPRNA